MSMEIKIELNQEDWRVFQKYLHKELTRSTKTFIDNFWFNLILWMVLGFIFMFIFRNFSSFHWPTAGIVSGLFCCIVVFTVMKIKKYSKAYEPSEKGVFYGAHNFKFSENGIHMYGNGYKTDYGWSIFKEVKRDSGLIMLFLDTTYAYIFPEDKLDDPDAFYRFINTYMEGG